LARAWADSSTGEFTTKRTTPGSASSIEQRRARLGEKAAERKCVFWCSFMSWRPFETQGKKPRPTKILAQQNGDVDHRGESDYAQDDL